MKKQLYQGDIPIVAIDEKYVKGIEWQKYKKPIVVAEGETTGHKHTLVADKCKLEWGQDSRGIFLKIAEGDAVITHEEHGQIVINPGVYFVGRQREYDEIEERIVRD